MPFNRRNLHLNPDMKKELSGAKSIFEVFYSCTTDTPPGAFPLWTGEWIRDCATLYPDFYNKAVEYRNSNRIRVLNNTAYENEIATYGECGAFVISGNNIRLPKINNYLRSYTSSNDVGKTLPAGLPNITGTFGGISRRTDVGWIHPTGAVSLIREPFGWGPAGSDPTYSGELQFDASKSNVIYGSSNTVQPPSIQLALYIQVYNHVVMEGYVNVSQTLNLINNYYNTMDQKVEDAINELKSQSGMIPDLTRMYYITLDAKAVAANIRDGVRTVYYVERPCWFLYWDNRDPADRDQMIQWCNDIQYVCVTPSNGDNNRNNFDAQIVDVTKQKNSSYDTMQIYDSRFHLIPLTPGMYYNFSAGTFVSTNETPEALPKTVLIPQYNSAYGALVHKYSVKMNWIARNQPLTYMSHTDLGVINV